MTPRPNHPPKINHHLNIHPRFPKRAANVGKNPLANIQFGIPLFHSRDRVLENAKTALVVPVVEHAA